MKQEVEKIEEDCTSATEEVVMEKVVKDKTTGKTEVVKEVEGKLLNKM